MKKLNIPVWLIQKYKEGYPDNEMFYLWVRVKCEYSSSVLILSSIYKVRKMMGVSYNKALELIERAKHCELFIYDEKNNSLIAKSFKSKERKYSKNGKHTYTSDYCKKIEKRDYTLRQMQALMRKALCELAISASEMDNFTMGSSQRNKTFRCAKSNDELTLLKLANTMGVSVSTASRLTTQLHKDGEIIKNPSKTVTLHTVNETTVAEFLKKHNRKRLRYDKETNKGYIVLSCTYQIAKREISESYKHVIYDHEKRKKTTNHSPKEPVCRIPQLLGY